VSPAPPARREGGCCRPGTRRRRRRWRCPRWRDGRRSPSPAINVAVNVPLAFLVMTIWIAVKGGEAVVGIGVVNAPLKTPLPPRLALRLLVVVPVAPEPGKFPVGRMSSVKLSDADARGAAATGAAVGSDEASARTATIHAPRRRGTTHERRIALPFPSGPGRPEPWPELRCLGPGDKPGCILRRGPTVCQSPHAPSAPCGDCPSETARGVRSDAGARRSTRQTISATRGHRSLASRASRKVQPARAREQRPLRHRPAHRARVNARGLQAAKRRALIRCARARNASGSDSRRHARRSSSCATSSQEEPLATWIRRLVLRALARRERGSR
jgi:hypothetical protein